MQPPTPLIRRLLGIAWLTFAVLVIGAAVAVSLARLLLPLADGYRAEIERLASRQLGRPVEIGRMTAGWYGLHPDLRFQDVRVLTPDGGATWLELREVRASIQVLPSLLNRRVETGSIGVVGGTVDVRRHDDGSYSVAGVELGAGAGAGNGGGRLLAWLALHERVRLMDGTLRWHDPRVSSHPLVLSGLSLRLDGGAGHWRIGGSGALAGQGGRSVAFLMDLAGDPADPPSLRTRLYAEGALQLGEWLDGSALAGLSGMRGDLDFRLWGNGGDRLDALAGDLELRQLRLASEGGPALERAAARLFWSRRERGWRLVLERLQVTRGGRSWPESGLQLRWAQNGDGTTVLEGALPFARLDDLQALQPALDRVAPEWSRMLERLQPRGDLRAAEWRLRSAPDGRPEVFLRTRFRDLGFAAFEGWPALAGADGALVANADSAHLALDSRGLVLNDPARFRAPLELERAVVQAYGARDAGGWRLDVPRFALRNPDLDVHGRLALSAAAGGTPYLDLRAALREGDVRAVRRYLPAPLMPQRVVEWLDRALAAGRIHDGRVSFRGPTSAFPAPGGEAHFEAEFAVDDLILEYARDWPRLEDAVAGVRFDDRRLEATVYAGKLLDLDVRQARVAIPALGAAAVVELDAALDGPVGDVLGYLRKGPLRADVPALLRELEAQGRSEVDLRLQVPVRHARDARVEGGVEFDAVAVHWPARGERFDDVRGRLRFAYRRGALSLNAEDVNVRWRETPARLDVHTTGTGAERRWRVELHTRQALRALLTGTPAPALPDFLGGEAQWVLGVSVAPPAPGGAMDVVLSAESDLRGVRVDLPPPLGKSRDTVRRMRLEAPYRSGALGPLRLRYGDLQALLALRDGTVERGEIRWGDGKVRLPGEPGLAVSGSVKHLPVSAWRNWLDARGGTGEGGWLQRIRRVDLRIGTLELLRQNFHDVELRGNRKGPYWEGDVHARELAGNVHVPADPDAGHPLLLDLAYLHLRIPDDEESPPLDPERLPPLQITSDLFTFNDVSFGEVEVVATRVEAGLLFQRLVIMAPYFRIQASGHWRNGPQGQISDFDVEATTDDLGEALTRSGFAGAIERGHARVELDAIWPGPPSRFELARMDGTLKLDIRRGQLLEVEPGGRGRIFGLLSLQALPRRLSLDFSDLFRRGFGFDQIQGTFAISDGDAYTNDLFMEGPSARVEISGRIGLDTRDYDQVAVVTPRVSSSIPVVGGLAGGPAVGLGLWVAERMFGKRIDELSQVQYVITGTWDDPTVQRVDESSAAGE